MDINTFRNKTKVIVTDELIKSVIDGFLNSDMPFYNEKNSLMDCVIIDKNNSGLVNSSDNTNFINEMMLNNLFDKYNGKEEYLKLDEETRKNLGKEEYDKIRGNILKRSKLIYSSKGVLDSDNLDILEHEFIIKVKPEDFIEVLRYFYREIRNNQLDGLRMLTPATKYVGAGYNAPIRLKCSSNDLENTLKLLDNVDEKIKAKTIPVLPIYNTVDSWYGYQQYSLSGKSSTASFCSAVYDAMFDAVKLYIEQDNLYITDGVTYKEYVTNSKNKFLVFREIIKKSLEQNEDLISSIVDITKTRLFDWNINMLDALRLPEVERNLDNIYGVVTKEETLEQKENDENNLVIETPVNITFKVDEISNQDDILPQNVDVVSTTQDPVVNEENQDGKINTDELLQDVSESSDLVLPEGFVATGKDEDLSKFENGISEVIQNITDLEEKNNSVGQIQGTHSIDRDALAASLTNDFINDEDVLIPDLSDVAYSGNSLREALTVGGYYNDFDYCKSLARHFKMSDYVGSPEQDEWILENLRHLEKSNNAGNPNQNVTEPVSSQDGVSKEASGPKLVLSNNRGINHKALRESLTHEFINDNNILIPDLSDVAYSGNSLKEALSVGGYHNDFEYCKSLAEHFKLNDYVESPEQDEWILNNLRHLELFNHDGTSIQTQNVETSATENINKDDIVSASTEEVNGNTMPADKYKGFVNDITLLDREVKNQGCTILEFFEKNNLLEYIKPDSKVIMHENSREITGKEFVSLYLIFYLINKGEGDLKSIMGFYIDEIKNDESKKRV